MKSKNKLLKLGAICLLCYLFCTSSYSTNELNDFQKKYKKPDLYYAEKLIKQGVTSSIGENHGSRPTLQRVMTTHGKVDDEDRAKADTISRFGHYEGYSKPIYDEWIRTSQYITMRDGIKIAIDIVRPALNGKPVEEPLPLVWTHSRYHRGWDIKGEYWSWALKMQTLIRHGYIAASVDARGCGASFGRHEGPFSPAESRDAYELTEWFAAQPWCDGNIGMYGVSYLGITQFMAASQAPPHLKAIFPDMALLPPYSFRMGVKGSIVPSSVFLIDEIGIDVFPGFKEQGVIILVAILLICGIALKKIGAVKIDA